MTAEVAAIVAATVVALALLAAWLVHHGYLTVTLRRPVKRNTTPKEGPQS